MRFIHLGLLMCAIFVVAVFFKSLDHTILALTIWQINHMMCHDTMADHPENENLIATRQVVLLKKSFPNLILDKQIILVRNARCLQLRLHGMNCDVLLTGCFTSA